MSEREKLIEELHDKFVSSYIDIEGDFHDCTDLKGIADFILEREDKIRRCEFCGSNDLVCGKAWKDEREKLLAEMKADRKRICEPLVAWKKMPGAPVWDVIDQTLINAGIVGREG